MQDFIIINEKDNVAVALQELPAGSDLDGIVTKMPVPQGHKVALADIGEGEPVIKYGAPIGTAKEAICAGEWVHTHNVKTGLGEQLSYSYQPEIPVEAHKRSATFRGYLRSDGRAGIRNEIWIIPTVGCVNDVAAAVAKKAKQFCSGSVSDVVSFSHPYGCSQMGDDQENSRKILADLALHPNAGGVLLLGLGCENSGVASIKPYMKGCDPQRVRFLVAQDWEDEVQAALSQVKELIAIAAEDQPQELSAAYLTVGLKCGGSDGLSGITANPLVGRFSDMLVSCGGTTVLTEVPEMFGAETLLMNRCSDEGLFLKTVDLINDFKDYFQRHGQVVYENPSPGNKAGGITTLEDKSLGCTQKSGTSPVRGVLAYGQRVEEKGLNLLSAPGNDLVASTALAAAGAQIVLFTTGRGTPFASPVPTVKIATNTALAEKKRNWIDFNAGVLVQGQDMDRVAERFFAYILAVASGEQTCSEKAGYRDMAIFKQGVTL